jgi:hypothetical protein
VAKVLISLPDTLVRRIDRTAQARGMTRSAYLAALAERDTAEQIGPGASPEVRRALAEIDELLEHTPAGDSTELIRAQRDAR